MSRFLTGALRAIRNVRREAEAARFADNREHEQTLQAMAEKYFRDQAARRNAELAPPAA